MKFLWPRRKNPVPGELVRQLWDEPIEEDTWKDELYRLNGLLKPFSIKFSIKHKIVTIRYSIEYWDR
jgi:hypothetical protein